MTNPLMNGPPSQLQQREVALDSHIEQQEDHLLEEFARLMGTEVSAVRLFDRVAGPAPGEVRQASSSPATAIEQIEDQESDAGAASTEASPKVWDEPPVLSSDSAPGETYSNAPSLEGLAPEKDAIVAPRKSGRATLMLGTVFAIGVVGVIGAWAAVKIAPGVGAAPLIGLAADESAKEAQPLHDTAPSTDRTASILPAGEAGEPNQVGPASSAEHASELPQPDKSPPAAPLAAPEPSVDPIATSAAPATRSITPADAAPVPATTADQNVAPAGGSESAPDPKPVKAALASQGGPVVAADNASAADAKPSSKPAEAAVLPTPSDTQPQPARAPVPVARPSFNSSRHAPPQPHAHKIAARAKSLSKPIDHAPNPNAGAVISASPPSLDLATAPGAAAPGTANAPAVTKASSETPSSTDSLLNFVPNLFEKGVGAVRGFVGDTDRGG